MSYPYERRKHYIEHSPESGEDDGSKRVQTRGVYQDTSTHQHRHAHQSPYHQAAQQSTEYPEEYLIENPTEGSIAQSIEDPNRYLYPFTDAHQAQGNYPTVGTSPVTEAFRSLGLTSWDVQPGPSQPYATSQMAGAGGGHYERPLFPDPDSNPYGPVALNITGLERPGSEPPYSIADDWWLRMSVANDHDLGDVARTLKRTPASVSDYVEVHNLAWTQRQDNQLGAMNVGEHSDMFDVRHHLDGSGYRYDYEVLARAKHLQPPSQQYPEPEPPQGSEEVAEGTTPHPEDSNPWGRDELRKLVEWEARYGRKWAGVELEIPGRTRRACGARLGKMSEAEKEQYRIPREHEEVNQPSLGYESGERYLKDEDLDFIKLKLAQGWTTKVISVESYRGFRERTIIKFVYFEGGWKPWTSEQDKSLRRMLSPESAEWSQISNDFPEPSRSKEEIEGRLEYLRQVENGEIRPLLRAPNYSFDADDDEYISLGVAREMGWEAMRREEFPDLHRKRLQDRASRIHAVWSAEDDRRLLDQNPGSGWGSIGRTYTPPRDAAVVQARWDYLHSEKFAELSRRRR